MKPRAKKTLQKYGLTEEAFAVLWEAHSGCCAICGISEDELTEKHKDWAPDQVLHVDHEKGTRPPRVRGLLCKDCNFDLDSYERKMPIDHPANRGTSYPRNDPRFRTYLKRTAGPRKRARSKKQQKEYVEQWLGKKVIATLTSGHKRTGMLSVADLGIPGLYEIGGDRTVYFTEDFAVMAPASTAK